FLIIRGNAYKLKRSLGSDEGIAPSRPELNLYESPVPLGLKGVHDSRMEWLGSHCEAQGRRRNPS
ncbi:MAG: hypothetical protein QXD28_07600, partial [Acidilobaceae archaeon]